MLQCLNQYLILKNFYNILKSLENINVVSVLPKNNRGIYGQAIADEVELLQNKKGQDYI